MSVHTMTPIREEEVESTVAVNVGTSTLKGDACVNANPIAETTLPVSGKEEVKSSSSTSTVVPVHKGVVKKELESGMIAIGYFYQVPSVKWHPQLEMMSKAGLTQGQYERKVLAQGYVYSL